MKQNIMLTLKGLVIGMFILIPGISVGTLAVLMGIYETLTESIGNFFTAPRYKKMEYTKFFLLIGIGLVCGLIFFLKVISFAMENYRQITTIMLVILILPSIPIITKGEDRKNKKNILFFTLGCIITGFFTFLKYKYVGPSNMILNTSTFNGIQFIKLVIAGAIASGAMIIPGISGTLLLVMMGEYYNVVGYLKSLFNVFANFKNNSTDLSISVLFSNVSIIPLLAFGIGVIIGLIFVARLINFLLKKWKSETLFFITGLVVISLIQIWLEM
ncbi:DUF368 domain-containing protein [Fusobacterium sp. PH5-44]|uniref:DUF368 domain-containing protein n=1 Tax=unclassified Fusobacterium TaxID=2648384 RepID=UPI003D20ECAE